MSRMGAQRLLASLSSISLLLLCMISGGHAHGGHMDKIPEGAAISDDPIVGLKLGSPITHLLTH